MLDIINWCRDVFETFGKNLSLFFGLALFFLLYLFLALIIHRKDRLNIEKMSIEKGVNVFFHYSWKGVFLKISHPTDRSKKTLSQKSHPPSTPSPSS